MPYASYYKQGPPELCLTHLVTLEAVGPQQEFKIKFCGFDSLWPEHELVKLEQQEGQAGFTSFTVLLQMAYTLPYIIANRFPKHKIDFLPSRLCLVSIDFAVQ